MRWQLIVMFLVCAFARGQARYHFGDNVKWADPAFDDSAWPQIPAGNLPIPAYHSDGFLWVRYRVPVPPGASPLAVRLGRENADAIPDEVWVNGIFAGSHGKFPPNPDVRKRYATVVFDLPPGLAAPGTEAVVAWRAWLPPAYAAGLAFKPQQQFRVEIAGREFMRTREAHAIAADRLSHSLSALLCLLETLLGAALVMLWLTTRGAPVLKWFSLLALLWGATSLSVLAPTYLRTDWPDSVYWLVWCLTSVLLNVSINEFLYAAFDVPRWTIHGLNVVGAVWAVPYAVAGSAGMTSPLLELTGRLGILLFGVWLVGQTVLVLWVLVRGPRETRGLAGTCLAWTVTLLLADVLQIVPLTVQLGGNPMETDTLATTVLIGVMCWLLLRRLWNDWRTKEELSAEFDAARSMQARLVPPAVDIPGFRIESAYDPARQVGGDFFRVLPGEEDAVLVIVGDVSGKGLGAAMTVAAIAGALDNEFSRRPGEVLQHLNRALLQRKGEGFVTCCAALLQSSGELTIANAGHLAPYAGGMELPVGTDLPLGLTQDVHYSETRLVNPAGDRLTFLSDGVVEAANAKGELFGFDRTREISGRSAPEIASAAKAWGQNDDITVVTVRRI